MTSSSLPEVSELSEVESDDFLANSLTNLVNLIASGIVLVDKRFRLRLSFLFSSPAYPESFRRNQRIFQTLLWFLIQIQFYVHPVHSPDHRLGILNLLHKIGFGLHSCSVLVNLPYFFCTASLCMSVCSSLS
ncbi:hypothetical protein BpHYR1_037723 [Brachionus plicatilis]|uniref:Uncharacterized protein n=1 Tax=Brachionus plicatilis TaxID=10195 RepID=A0A3M7SB50_BRAPC|nr:hypothetical protein BpHYR1_037723 [Brachionus plicatilis]